MHRGWLVTSRLGRVALLLAVGALLGLGPAGPAGGASGGSCPVHALDKSQGKTELVFWHVLTAENEKVLRQLLATFEQRHPNIHVKLVNQTTYPDLFDKFIAGLRTGDLPDIGQFEETTVQQLVDSQSTVTMADCVKADHYPVKDFLPRTLAYYSTQGALRAMPWVISNPVIIFNKTAVVKAGLDPSKPPDTLDLLRSYAAKIVATGAAKHGMALHIEPFVNEFLYAKSGLQYVNNSNGRTARATKSLLDVPDGVKIWTWWRDMVKSGLAVDTGSTPGDVSHLYALGTGDAAMTFEASGALGPIDAVLATGQFAGTQIGVWPLPALRAGGGVPVGDGSLWIAKAASSAKKAAAWELIKFLVSPDQQAALNVSSRGGYIPIRVSALDDPALKALWGERPYLRVPYDQLEAGPNNATTAGSVIGAYQAVRDAVREGFVRMLAEGQSPRAALREAATNATAAIREYNSRVGAG